MNISNNMFCLKQATSHTLIISALTPLFPELTAAHTVTSGSCLTGNHTKVCDVCSCHDNTNGPKGGPPGASPRTSEQADSPKKSLRCQTPPPELETKHYQTGYTTAGETAELRRSWGGVGEDTREEGQDHSHLLFR